MFLKFSKNDILIVFGLSLLRFGVGFISSMVIPIFPSLIRIYSNNSMLYNNYSVPGRDNDTNYNYHQLSLLFVTKNLCQMASSPIAGYLTDFFGALLVLLGGTFFQILAMLVYGLGNVYYMWIFGRIFEAISATVINCASAAFVAYKFKDHKQRGFAYGIKALSTCIGSALGPAYGGVLYEYYGKHTVFLSFILFIFIEIGFVLLIIFREKTMEKKSKNILKTEINLEPNCNSKDSTRMFQNNENNEKETFLKEGENQTVQLRKTRDIKDIKQNMKVVAKEELKNNFLFFKDPYFLLSLCTFPVVFVTLYLLFSSLPRYMVVRFNSSESQQGIIWLVTLLGYALGFISGNVINMKLSTDRHTILMGYTFLHGLAILCIPFMPTWWSVAIPLCIIVHVHLVMEVVLSPILASIVEIRHNSRFGVMSGIIMMAMAITGSLGSFLGPILLSTIGFMYTNIGICVINAIFGPFYLFLKRFCQTN